MVDIYNKINPKEVKAKAVSEAGFSDNFFAAAEESFKVGTEYGRQSVFKDLVEAQRKIIEDNKLGIMIPGMIQKVNNGRPIQSEKLLEIIKKNRDEFDRIRSERPELGLKTVSELEEAQLSEFSNIMSTAQKAADDATFMGFVGNIAGQALGPFQDPLNAATLFYPAAKVTSTMSYMQAIKAGAIAEAKAAAFPLAVNKPGEISVRRELGEDVSVGQAALETGLEIGGAALIGGAVGAAAKRFTRVIDDVSSVEAQKHPNLTEAEHAEAVNKSIQEIDAPYAKSDIPEPDVKPVDVKPPTLKKDPDLDIEVATRIDDTIKEMDSDINIYNKIRTCLTGGQ